MFASHLFAVVSAPKMQQKGEKKNRAVADCSKKQLIRLSANLGHM